MTAGEDLPVKVYEGEPSDVAFLKSLFDSAGIDVVTAGHFFGGRDIYVRRRDADAARAILADFEQNRSRKGDVIKGPWSGDKP